MYEEDDVNNSADPVVHYQFAHQCQESRQYQKAITHFNKAISLDPDRLDAEVYAFAAWLLARCPVESLRDTRLAISYATVACEITDWQEGWTIGILAACLAADGDYAEAIRLQEQACDLAFDSDSGLQQENLRRLQAKQPIPFDCYP